MQRLRRQQSLPLKLRMPLAPSSQPGCRRRRRRMKLNTPNMTSEQWDSSSHDATPTVLPYCASFPITLASPLQLQVCMWQCTFLHGVFIPTIMQFQLTSCRSMNGLYVHSFNIAVIACLLYYPWVTTECKLVSPLLLACKSYMSWLNQMICVTVGCCTHAVSMTTYWGLCSFRLSHTSTQIWMGRTTY